jgi:hypothetical protein
MDSVEATTQRFEKQSKQGCVAEVYEGPDKMLLRDNPFSELRKRMH